MRRLLLKTGPGKLSAQLRCAYVRCAYAFALDHGYQGHGYQGHGYQGQDYQGIVTIDGNDKDDPEAIPRFIDALKQGLDVVQASRWTLFRLSLRASRSV